MERERTKGKKGRAREDSEEGAGSPFYSVGRAWLLPGNLGVELR